MSSFPAAIDALNCILETFSEGKIDERNAFSQINKLGKTLTGDELENYKILDFLIEYMCSFGLSFEAVGDLKWTSQGFKASHVKLESNVSVAIYIIHVIHNILLNDSSVKINDNIVYSIKRLKLHLKDCSEKHDDDFTTLP